jgi:hypothetical protein
MIGFCILTFKYGLYQSQKLFGGINPINPKPVGKQKIKHKY